MAKKIINQKVEDVFQMTLGEALDHLEKENRKIPLVNLYGVIMVDEAQCLLEEISSKDHQAFYLVAIALSKKELDLVEFNELNSQRSSKLKKEVKEGFDKMMNVSRSQNGTLMFHSPPKGVKPMGKAGDGFER